MPSDAAPGPASPVCCGEGGTWAPAGEALVLGCQLCPKSPTYWRTNRADGRPYEPMRALDDPDSPIAV